jgi:hypothetical protein
MRQTLLVALFIATYFSKPAFADQWVTSVTVTQAIVGLNGGAYAQILTSGTVVNPAACPFTDSYVVRDPALLSGALAVGLAAVASGHPIRVYVLSSACDTATQRPLVTAIGLT